MLSAKATIETAKASRYLKALCNHFNRKVEAEYDDERGTVQFGFAYCEMHALGDTLVIDIQAETDSEFDRVKYVISDHLERFGASEGLAVVWVNEN
jgi:hypothetical protein